MIGWLSRFHEGNGAAETGKLLAIISGPEPQRGIFMEKVLRQLKDLELSAVLVAGEPGAAYRRREGNVDIVNHLPAGELEHAIHSADVVISRSGYSTVMDLIATRKKAIFVPTPQQPEQMFLARHLMEQGIAYAESQSDFSLERALAKAREYKGLSAFSFERGLLENEIERLLL
jgi:uncharacterized protein (TIGR00661 family)